MRLKSPSLSGVMGNCGDVSAGSAVETNFSPLLRDDAGYWHSMDLAEHLVHLGRWVSHRALLFAHATQERKRTVVPTFRDRQ